MHLFKFEIRNFKCIEHVALQWEDILIIIGENNSGKSTILSALSIFLSGSNIKDSSLFRKHKVDSDNAIELIGYFDQLNTEEQNQIAVRGRMHNGQWVLKKRYWFESGEGGEAAGWKEQLYSYTSLEAFAGWPEQDNSWGAFPAAYQPLIDALPNRGTRPTNASREALRGSIRNSMPELVTAGPADWISNPGGGGNWKSNANSILPRPIFVRAVQEATDETNSKEVSTYGRLVGLIVERSLAQRPEMTRLQSALDDVLALFRPDETNPDRQAEEIRELQRRINASLNEIVGGEARIRTDSPEVKSMVLPSTSLVIRDAQAGIETDVAHQGHGLQRTLIITLLQLLADAQSQSSAEEFSGQRRATILLLEEPELFLHPQMERLMRDVLQRLAGQPQTQVACCTHSPVFLSVSDNHRAIVRVTKNHHGDATAHQVIGELFSGTQAEADKQRLNVVARFDPTVNELFFAKQVVLVEEFSAVVAFEKGAELMGLFDRHVRLRREVSIIDCNGKANIPAFQRVLNAFAIPHLILHDEDPGNANERSNNERIMGLTNNSHAQLHLISPDLEGSLGYTPPSKSKPYVAVCKVQDLFNNGGLPAAFQQAVCWAYFGQVTEPDRSG